MTNLKYKTKGDSSPDKKPRVYFTCHPDDFAKSFEKIRKDIFETHDCAIYYTEDMTVAFDEADVDIDIGNMNLFVIPVTSKLLTTPNRTMDFDLKYAKRKTIPVLPIMMEPGIDVFYSHPDKFGELQYLNPYSSDSTEISYEEKLKKYLESVLISDEMAKRVRAAFDAYIFLSYRKKDRRYANELMRLIHAKSEFRDIAIWYDEFLTPGESFNENIGRMLGDSKLFALLVTPNLLEEPDGKPNFVMGKEYPMAKNSGMDILPAEMEDTDKDELSGKFDGIPECVNPHDDEAFKTRLVETLGKIAKSDNDDDPEHNFLIGLAYLEGIDVEVDRERGIELITKAAESNLLEAMEKLIVIYRDGIGVEHDLYESLKWREQHFKWSLKNYKEDGSKCNARHLLDSIWSRHNGYEYVNDEARRSECLDEMIELSKKILYAFNDDDIIYYNIVFTIIKAKYEFEKRKLVEAKKLCMNAQNTFESLSQKQSFKELMRLDTVILTSLGEVCAELGEFSEAKKYYDRSLKIRKLRYDNSVAFEETHDLAVAYGKMGELVERYQGIEEAREYYTNAYELSCRAVEEKNYVLPVYNYIVNSIKMGDILFFIDENDPEALKKYADAYIWAKELVEMQPETNLFRLILVAALQKIGDLMKSIELFEGAEKHYREAFEITEKIINSEEGEYNTNNYRDHSVNYIKLADLLCEKGENEKDINESLKLYMKAYEIRNAIHEAQPSIQSLVDLASIYERLGVLYERSKDYQNAERFYKKAISARESLSQTEVNNNILCYLEEACVRISQKIKQQKNCHQEYSNEKQYILYINFKKYGDADEKNSDYERALMNYKISIEHLSTLERITGIEFYDEHADLCERIAYCYEMTKRIGEAKDYYEMAVVLSIKAFHAENSLKSYDTVKDYLYGKLGSFCEDFGIDIDLSKYERFLDGEVQELDDELDVTIGDKKTEPTSEETTDPPITSQRDDGSDEDQKNADYYEQLFNRLFGELPE